MHLLTHADDVLRLVFRFLSIFPDQRNVAQCNSTLWRVMKKKTFYGAYLRFKQLNSYPDTTFANVYAQLLIEAGDLKREDSMDFINFPNIARNRYLDVLSLILKSPGMQKHLKLCLQQKNTIQFFRMQLYYHEIEACDSPIQRYWYERRLDRGSTLKKRFMFACEYGQIELLKYYFALGARSIVNTSNGDGEVPLTLIIQKNFCVDTKVEMIRILYQNGIDLNQKNSDTFTALHRCCMMREINTPIITFLIDHGADINALTENHLTPLHYALVHHQYEETNLFNIIQYLVSNGASLNIPNCEYGLTPLMAAVLHSNELTVQYLINKGANVNLRNKFGNTAAQLAEQCHSTDSWERSIYNLQKIEYFEA